MPPARLVPFPVGPHPLFGRLADEGLELRLQRGGPGDRVRRQVVVRGTSTRAARMTKRTFGSRNAAPA